MLARWRDVIIKPIFGSMGHGLVRVADPDVALRVVRPLEQMRAVFYVQRAIDHGGRDVRSSSSAAESSAPSSERPRTGDWRTNVARGGTARPFDVPAEWRDSRCARRAAVGADYAGVDLLLSRDGRASSSSK